MLMQQQPQALPTKETKSMEIRPNKTTRNHPHNNKDPLQWCFVGNMKTSPMSILARNISMWQKLSASPFRPPITIKANNRQNKKKRPRQRQNNNKHVLEIDNTPHTKDNQQRASSARDDVVPSEKWLHFLLLTCSIFSYLPRGVQKSTFWTSNESTCKLKYGYKKDQIWLCRYLDSFYTLRLRQHFPLDKSGFI